MTVLYRKYRPQAFADVAGQEHVKTTLLREIATGRLAHAYLFTGPRGVGKTTVARLLAKAINCPERASAAGEPCARCEACTEIAEGRALDVIEIDAASQSGVDNVREQIIENARFAPAKLPRKVYIIDEVHMLSTAAFNALLKTLEEPPAHVVFVLATTELHKLPATVVSRCQRFEFRRIAHDDLLTRLEALAGAEKAEVDRNVLELVARHSEGCLRDAESLLSQLLSLGEKRITLETAALLLPVHAFEETLALAGRLAARDAAGALDVWERLCHSGADPVKVVSDLIDVVRASAIAVVRGKSPEFPLVSEPRGLEALTSLGARASADLIERLVRAREDMKRSETPELAFELLIVESAARDADDRRPPPSPPTARVAAAPPASKKTEAAPIEKRETTAAPTQEPASQILPTEAPMMELSSVRDRWSDVLAKAQETNHALPYMLGVGELLSIDGATLTIGFQYAMYRDRLNERKYREALERALTLVFGGPLRVKAVLVAQRLDGGADIAPGIRVETPADKLPDGFAELVKEFGGTVAS